MIPSEAFRAVPEHCRFRSEATGGGHHVVAETYLNKETKFLERGTVYVAREGAAEFTPLPWNIDWRSRLKVALRAMEWPPQDRLNIVRVDSQEIVARYTEIGSMYDDDWPLRDIRYSFERRLWRVGRNARTLMDP